MPTGFPWVRAMVLDGRWTYGNVNGHAMQGVPQSHGNPGRARHPRNGRERSAVLTGLFGGPVTRGASSPRAIPGKVGRVAARSRGATPLTTVDAAGTTPGFNLRTPWLADVVSANGGELLQTPYKTQ